MPEKKMHAHPRSRDLSVQDSWQNAPDWIHVATPNLDTNSMPDKLFFKIIHIFKWLTAHPLATALIF
jgi:hypothetical protein